MELKLLKLQCFVRMFWLCNLIEKQMSSGKSNFNQWNSLNYDILPQGLAKKVNRQSNGKVESLNILRYIE